MDVAIPSSTPFPVPGFHNADSSATPAEFLKFLRSLITQYLGDNSPRIAETNRDAWVTIINGLADHFLGSFPPPDIVSWNTMDEKVVVTEATLEVIKRVFSCVDGIYSNSEELVRKMFARLLDLCRVLDVWADTETVCGEGSLTPVHMKEKALEVLVSVLRGLGDNSPVLSGDHEPSWKTLRGILQECLDVCRDLTGVSAPLSTITVVVFFKKPRIITLKDRNSQEQEPEENPLNVAIAPATRIPPFLALIINVVVKTLIPPIKCQWLLADITRKTAEFAQSLVDYCLNSVCMTTPAIRTNTLTNIIATTASLRRMPEYRVLMGDFPEKLLQIRMESILKFDWDIVDRFLSAIFATEDIDVSDSLIHAVLHQLQQRPSDSGLQSLLWSYLRNTLPRMDAELRVTLGEKIESVDATPERTALLKQLAEVTCNTPPPSHRTKAGKGLVIPPHVWRQRVHDLIQEIVTPDVISWMDDDDGPSAFHLCQRAMFEIEIRFDSRPEPWTNSRLQLVEKLADLPCLLAQCEKTNCLAQHANKFLTISPYIPVLARILNGTADEVTAELRRKTYNTFEIMLKHHNGVEFSESAMDLIFHGMGDFDRSVRISAGYALNGLVQTYVIHSEEDCTHAAPIFARLYNCFDIAKNPVRETLLVAIGSMGKTNNPDILGQVLCFLVAQLGRQNPVIKGLACMHILAIAKHHQKAPYSLILPYLDDIAPFIIKRLPTQPDLITEACSVLSIGPNDFIAITLPRTLPGLFAHCDQKVLNAISKELSRKASNMLIKHCHVILAHIFLLSSQAATTKALNFVIQILTADATGSSIDIQSVVKSCVVPLLAALVVVMGDENKDVAQQGIIALKKVEHVLASGKKNVSSPSNLGFFLKTYMLGLISDINDMLQDVQGKKTVNEKRKILRCLGALVEQIGASINHVSPQIMATFQTMVSIPELSEVTMESWYRFLTTLGATELGPHIGPTSAAIVASWDVFSQNARDVAFQALEYIVCTMGANLEQHLGEIVDLSVIGELQPLHAKLKTLRGTLSAEEELQRILAQSSSDNLTVAMQALRELKSFMSEDHKEYIRQISSGDIFNPMIGRILASLFAAACRDSGDSTESLRLLSFECIGVLGAMDPDRCEIPYRNTNMVVMNNYADEGEAVLFALHLIQDLLVGAFRSTSDIKYQSHLAYSIQELLKFCQFTPVLVAVGSAGSVPIKVRNRWNALPKHVLETVTPLLEGRFTLNQSSTPDIQHPIYSTQSTYREWIQLWTTYLITRVSGPTAQRLFGVFRSAVRNKDVVVAHHLLPHLILNILISGNEDDALSIRTEMITVLNDQVDAESNSTSDKKLLSAQAVFMLLDHLNKWIRVARQELSKKPDAKRARTDRANSHLQDQLLRLDSILLNIDQSLMAKAAFQCKAFARSLMNFEQQIILLQERDSGQSELPGYYDKLHEIYAHLDEPDGMEGISTMILSPSLEHQIRQHESTGRWTSAQSCWEVRLQESPDNVDFHIGLLKCLRNLGHYDTLRTHVTGVLTRHPNWQSTLAGFQVESAWMVGAWDDVERLVNSIDGDTSSMATARVLLAMRTGESKAISDSLSQARSILGAPITAAGAKGYRRSYEAVLDLHLTHELELIYQATCAPQPGSQDSARQRRRGGIAELSKTLACRLNTTLPTFRSREPLLSMRRTAFTLSKISRLALNREIGKTWLASAKIARKAGQWQTAYSAMLQAQQRKASYSFIESAKLIKATGDPLRAINELENSIKLLGLFDENVVDLTLDAEAERMKAKILVLQARWMNDCDRFDTTTIYNVFNQATILQKRWESAHYYLGQFHDDCFKALPPSEQIGRGLKMNAYTVKCFCKAIMHGSKFVYQTVPRMLTIWLDLGEDSLMAQQDSFKKMTDDMSRTIKGAPLYKWFTAFPQIVSRVAHDNPEVFQVLAKLIVAVMYAYPRQSLWLFTSVMKSTKSNRSARGKVILSQLRNNPHSNTDQTARLVNESINMTNELLNLCDYPVDDNRSTLSMAKDFPRLKALGRSNMIIPLQESLTASLPPESTAESTHQPFPSDAPTFHDFADEIDVMKSLAKPRKITIRGSNGQIYMFLGKPKDDLRKDARLMDLNSIINKLLKGNSESRRRQLHIRTYGVVALNEECGFIQWVPNTVPIRPVLHKYYLAKRVTLWTSELGNITNKMKIVKKDEEAVELFQKGILSVFKPVLHEWFIETFPEPTAWLASRLTYGRTAAVMSMVGFILGLGDRHCENILLDTNSGDVVHVDFNCLFEKGKLLETPERVPFRLTQNIVDGLGISGVEGVFRIACEVTLQLLRDNRESLMSVLDAFVHDPLVEWEDEKRRLDRDMSRKHVANQAAVPNVKIDTKALAKTALNPIEKKLRGIYIPNHVNERHEREVSTSNLVQMLIQEATNVTNLARMYVGWAPWH